MERLQPDHRSFEPDPDAEDRGYDDARQRELDEQLAAERRAADDLERMLAGAVRLARVADDELAKDAIRFIYMQGKIDALLAVKP